MDWPEAFIQGMQALATGAVGVAFCWALVKILG